MKPIRNQVLIGSTLLASWLGMQAVHEAGHVLGAKVTGGRVDAVCLHPLTISHTEFSENPAPLFVVWAGPIVGVVVPLLAWAIAAMARWSAAFLLRFFAGFCLIANGAYIAAGSLAEIGDAAVMLRNDSPNWLLWAFGIVTVPTGLALWHNQGRMFGLGPRPEPVRAGHVGVAVTTSVSLIMIGLIFSNC
jgi:hypothetical protein